MSYYGSPIFWKMLPSLLVLTGIVFVVGQALLRVIGRGSPSRRVHGEFVFWWSLSGYILGWLLAPVTTKPDTPEGVSGMAGFGLLLGWLVGTLHGGIVIWSRSSRTASRSS